MKQAKKKDDDELRAEYKAQDFPKLGRGKHVDRIRASSNVVVIDPGLTHLLPNADAVNAALRALSEIARRAR